MYWCTPGVKRGPGLWEAVFRETVMPAKYSFPNPK